MNISTFIEKLNNDPSNISFDETMAVIDANYDFVATAFKNGELENAAGQNNGSCKLFAFAKLHNLNEGQTLACFGDYYRKDVLGNPDGADHQNIRNFMKYGWEGIAFETPALSVLPA